MQKCPSCIYHMQKHRLLAGITVHPELNSYKLGNLKSGTVYEIQMSGCTKPGEGVRSKTSLFTTKQAQGYIGLPFYFLTASH